MLQTALSPSKPETKMSSPKWLIAKSGTVEGPFSLQEMSDKIASGEVTRRSRVRSDHRGERWNWNLAGFVREFYPAFRTVKEDWQRHWLILCGVLLFTAVCYSTYHTFLLDILSITFFVTSVIFALALAPFGLFAKGEAWWGIALMILGGACGAGLSAMFADGRPTSPSTGSNWTVVRTWLVYEHTGEVVPDSEKTTYGTSRRSSGGGGGILVLLIVAASSLAVLVGYLFTTVGFLRTWGIPVPFERAFLT